MKRKFKLITTIASLTAAIALLMFGVYAAAVRQVNVSGTVSFTASNIKATVQVYERVGEDAEHIALQPWSLLATLKYDVDGSVLLDGVAVTGENPQDLQEVDLLGDDEDSALTDTTLVYQYRVVVSNNFTANGSSITVQMTNVFEAPTQAWVLEEVSNSLDAEDAEALVTLVANTGVVTYIFTYSIVPALAPQSDTFDIGSGYAMYRA